MLIPSATMITTKYTPFHPTEMDTSASLFDLLLLPCHMNDKDARSNLIRIHIFAVYAA